MITLYNFGRAFGLPDPSPFVMKTEVLLKMAALPYTLDPSGFRKAPRGKVPYIRDGQAVISDSTLIRFWLEETYQARFDADYQAYQLALAWAVERMLEEHFYFGMVYSRWLDEANFQRGPARFFDPVPLPFRALIRSLVRKKIRKALYMQGMGRYSEAEIVMLMKKDLDAVALCLGDKPFLLGDRPCGADATVFAFISSILCTVFETPVRDYAVTLKTLVDYRDRMMQCYYPEMAKGNHPATALSQGQGPALS